MDKVFKKEVLATALEAVDKEHEMIHVILDKIKYAYAGDVSEGLKKSFIKELYQFLDFHFTSEENLLALFDYPEHQRHKTEHDGLRHKLAEIIGSLDFESIDYEDIELFVTDWLKSHTRHSDAHVTEYLNAQFDL
jgi:hemerythrin-like metal-binding protein